MSSETKRWLSRYIWIQMQRYSLKRSVNAKLNFLLHRYILSDTFMVLLIIISVDSSELFCISQKRTAYGFEMTWGWVHFRFCMNFFFVCVCILIPLCPPPPHVWIPVEFSLMTGPSCCLIKSIPLQLADKLFAKWSSCLQFESVPSRGLELNLSVSPCCD